MSILDQVTISIRPYQDKDSGDWRVDCIVTGLQSEKQALIAADFITAMLCAAEIKEQ